MKFMLGIGVALQLTAIGMPAISAETQSSAPQPTQPINKEQPTNKEPRSATVPERSQDTSDHWELTQPDDKTQLSERDRLILERYLIRIIPRTSD
ncbi:MAG: hypothetical protein KME27_21010 [Lyngbya sp. HA4199-MV5]|jgi:hypothetical protein|nr:hypothetical protein [Lyngbya sp. HA4199-MV5]